MLSASQESARITARSKWGSLVIACVTAACLMVAPTAATAQSFDESGFGQSGSVFGDVSFGGIGNGQQEPVLWQGSYQASGSEGKISIVASLGGTWHIYSTTQPPGGPLRTEFTVVEPEGVSVTGKFEPDQAPDQSVSDTYQGVTIEEHTGEVTWTAPIKLPDGYRGEITVKTKALVCGTGGSCMPANETLTLVFAGELKGTSKPASDKPASERTRSAMPSATSSTRSLFNKDSLKTGRSSGMGDFLPGAASDEQNTDVPVGEALLAAKGSRPTTFFEEDYEVVWTAGVSSSIKPGGEGTLVFRASPTEGYHVYQAVVDDSESSTNFVVTRKSGLRVAAPQTSQSLIDSSTLPSIPGIPDAEPVKYFDGDVAWTLPVQVPEGTAPGDYEIDGRIIYQACTDSSCLPPKALQFVATVMVTDQTDLTLQSITMKTAPFLQSIDLAAETKWVDAMLEIPAEKAEAESSASQEIATRSKMESHPDAKRSMDAQGEITDAGSDDEGDKIALAASGAAADSNVSDSAVSETAGEGSRTSLALILLMALGGGLILNLMPCVLPVVGLKLMSFVEQAGQDRKRVFQLNFAYVAGILSIFAGLTFLAVFASFGWGQQFTYFPVRIGLTVMIFALALSYLGVWELPTPGMATSQTSQELQEKEGLTGAFFKGAFSTILATPCSGPLLGVVLGYTLTMPAIQTAAVMMTVGLGMSLPYIILGLFPGAIGFMPKPGNWMVNLKEFMAFLFLGTVAFFFSQFSAGQKLPVFVTLIGVWFGCWIIGKVPPWEVIQKRVIGWTVGASSAAAIGVLAFFYLGENPRRVDQAIAGNVNYIVEDHVSWEPYSEQRLQELQAAGKTVMLDFTASWCVNCKINTNFALDTEATSKLLNDLNAVAMLADWSDQNEAVKSKLAELKSNSIPVLAIYPGSRPTQPIVLRDLVSQASVLKALDKAGPSLDAAAVAARANQKRQASRLTSAKAAQGEATTP